MISLCFKTYLPLHLFHSLLFDLGAYYDDGARLVDKKSLLNAIISCRKSHNKEDYLKNRAALMRLGGELNVKPGQTKKFVKFSQYFFCNWDCVAPMWVYSYRKQLPLQVVHFLSNLHF